MGSLRQLSNEGGKVEEESLSSSAADSKESKEAEAVK